MNKEARHLVSDFLLLLEVAGDLKIFQIRRRGRPLATTRFGVTNSWTTTSIIVTGGITGIASVGLWVG